MAATSSPCNEAVGGFFTSSSTAAFARPKSRSAENARSWAAARSGPDTRTSAMAWFRLPPPSTRPVTTAAMARESARVCVTRRYRCEPNSKANGWSSRPRARHGESLHWIVCASSVKAIARLDWKAAQKCGGVEPLSTGLLQFLQQNVALAAGHANGAAFDGQHLARIAMRRRTLAFARGNGARAPQLK